jgi:hypothetical protein
MADRTILGAKGPQHLFYLPSGILNPGGDNVLAIAVWNRGGVGD